MDLIHYPTPVQLMARSAAPIARFFPHQIMKLRFFMSFGRSLNWKHPSDLFDYIIGESFKAAKDPEKKNFYGMLADKVAVRQYVGERVGTEALTELYGTWDNPDEIDYDALPVPCVIKTNNSCATNIIIRNRQDLRPREINKTLNKWLHFPYGALTGQPHYSVIKPKILCEEFLQQDPGSDELPYDYKFFCFKGKPRFILFYSGRKANHHLTYNLVYDTDWKLIPGVTNKPAPQEAPRPATLERMLDMARKLSSGLPFARVDFYSIGERPVFGEITLTPDVITNFTPEFLTEVYQRYCL